MRFRYRVAVLLPTAACIGLICGCPSAGGSAGSANENQNDNAGGGAEVALPAKSIDLELIGIHDLDSGDYDGDCIGCHEERIGDLALDGVTPLAHSTMLDLFGVDNARCTACHRSGPDFATYSTAGLRKQVDMTTCAACHGETAQPPAQSYYVQ